MSQLYNAYCTTCHVFVARKVSRLDAENSQHMHAEQKHGKNLKHVSLVKIVSFE